MSYAWLSTVPSFKKSLIVEQFQGNYLKSNRVANARRSGDKALVEDEEKYVLQYTDLPSSSMST